MASSGSFSGSIKEGHYKLRVDWSQSKNLDNNTSTVTCKMYLVNDYSLSIKGRENTCTIDGTQIAYSSPAISSTGTHLLGTASKTVNHNSDGSKFISISAVFNIQATLSGTFYSKITASANITLDSIARASTVSSSDMTMGSAGTIKITRASSSFTHTLTYTFGSATGTIAATPTWSWWIVEQIMSVPVTIAERHLLVMGRRKESIVRMTVIAQTDLEVERGENTRSTYQ